jgi:type IV secretory pathway VirB10-like protein
MDLIAEAQDWPKSGEFAKRFKMMLPPGVIPEDEMTPEMKAVQASNQQLQDQQRQLAAAESESKSAKAVADAKNAEARANLALAQAYKAVLDAHSRAKDVESKDLQRESAADDQDFRHTVELLDQHARLQGEDRDFALRENEAQSRDDGNEFDL